MLTGKQRAFLRSKATALDCTVQIGKSGVTENLLVTIEQALTAHEMVKIKVLENCPYTPREASDGICAALDAEGVQCIGGKFVLFKISPEHRLYDLDKLAVIEEKKQSAPTRRGAQNGSPAGGRAQTGKKSGAPSSARPGKPRENGAPAYTVKKRTK